MIRKPSAPKSSTNIHHIATTVNFMKPIQYAIK